MNLHTPNDPIISFNTELAHNIVSQKYSSQSERKYFQEGKLSVNSKGSCCFSSLNEQLNEREYLRNFHKGERVYMIIQSTDYADQVREEYLRGGVECIGNTYLYEQYGIGSAYLSCLQAMVDSMRVISQSYCEYTMILKRAHLARVSTPLFVHEIATFLERIILPHLRQLKLRTVLSNRFHLETHKHGQLDYDIFFENYLQKVVVRNVDLHYYIHYFFDILDKITDGDTNFNSYFFMKDAPLLELEPFINIPAIAISYFYHKLRENETYSKSNLPRITFINLDSFDHGFANFNSFGENSKNFQYISLFDDDFPEANTPIKTEEEFSKDKDSKEDYSYGDSTDNSFSTDEFIDDLEEKGKKKDVTWGTFPSSITDTFGWISEDESPKFFSQRPKDLYMKNSLFLPLASTEIEKRMSSMNYPIGESDWKISSGKVRMIMRDYIFPMVRNFQPDIVIVSHSLANNRTSHKNGRISINPRLFAEIIQQMSSFSNSNVIYCPRVLKNLSYTHNSYQQEQKLSFDERYFIHTMQNYAFDCPQQIFSSMKYFTHVFGAFMQLQQGQWNFNIAKTLTSNEPHSMITNIQFYSRILLYMRYLSLFVNPTLNQLIPTQKNQQAHLQLIKQFAFNHNDHTFHQFKRAQINFYQSIIQEKLFTLNLHKDLTKYLQPQNHIIKSLKNTPFVSNNILIIFLCVVEKKVICEAERCYFRIREELINLTEQSQYYVDYKARCVYIFNVLGKEDLIYRHFRFELPQQYPHDSDGILSDFRELPPFPGNLSGPDQLLIEFSLSSFRNQVFVIFGKVTQKKDYLKAFITKSEYEYQVSPFIFSIDCNPSSPLQWIKIVVQQDEISCTKNFMPQPLLFERLYAATIIIDKSNNEKNPEPVLFVFGGLLSHMPKSPDLENMPLLCNIISRFVPSTPNDIKDCIWLHSTLIKDGLMPNLRPLCNSMAIEVRKKKILLVGGTHNKYLVPLRNSQIYTYLFSIDKDISTSSKKKGEFLSNTLLAKGKKNGLDEFSSQLELIIPEGDCPLTNAALSNQSRNIYQSEYLVPQLNSIQTKSSTSSNGKQKLSIPPFFIALNEDKFLNEKLFLKTDNNLQSKSQFISNDLKHTKDIVCFPPSTCSFSSNNLINSQKKERQKEIKHFPLSEEITDPTNNIILSIQFGQIPSSHKKYNSLQEQDTTKFIINENLSYSHAFDINRTTESLQNLNNPTNNQLNYQNSIGEQSSRYFSQNQIFNKHNLSNPNLINISNQNTSQEIHNSNYRKQSEHNYLPTSLFQQNCNISPSFSQPILNESPLAAPGKGDVGISRYHYQGHLQSISNKEFGGNGGFSLSSPSFQNSTNVSGIPSQNIHHLKAQIMQSQQSYKTYDAAFPGTKVGILHVAVIHFENKGKQKQVRIDGGSLRDDLKFKNVFPTLYTQLNQSVNLQEHLQKSVSESHQQKQLHYNKLTDSEQSQTQNNIYKGERSELIYSALMPNENYYQNYLYFVTINESGKIESQIKIEVKINLSQNSQPEYITPLPDQIRGFQISECGQIFFLVFKENTSIWYILYCQKSLDFLLNRCLKFDRYIKYRNNTQLYARLKQQLQNIAFKTLSLPEQDKQKKAASLLLEEEQNNFDLKFETNGFQLLVDSSYLYLLSPKIIKKFQSKQDKLDYFNQLTQNDQTTKNGQKKILIKNDPIRFQSSHLIYPYKTGQEALQLVAQGLDWFQDWEENDVKVLQKQQYVVLILNRLFQRSIINNQIVYELKYKLIPKIETKMEIKESVDVYTYRFMTNRLLIYDTNIHIIENIPNHNKDDMLIILIEKDCALSDSSLAISFVLPHFHPSNTQINQIQISPNGLFPFTSKSLFFQLTPPTQTSYFGFDPSSNQSWNFLSQY